MATAYTPAQIARKRARDKVSNRRYVAKRKDNPITRNADRLIRRVKYLRKRAVKRGETGDICIAGMYQWLNDEWVLMDFYATVQAAKGSVWHHSGQRWENRPALGEYLGYEIGVGLKYQIVVKSAQAFHNALRVYSRGIV